MRIISNDRYRDFRKAAKNLKDIEERYKWTQDSLDEQRQENRALEREITYARRETTILYGLFFLVCILCVVIIELKKGGYFK